MATTLDRFWGLADKRGPADCWLWKARLSPKGYGQIALGGRGAGTMSAHRFAYSRLIGPIPDGMVVMHTCDVRHCVNPAHLRLGTQAENMDDMRAKGRDRPVGPKGERQHLARLTERAVREIRASSDGCTVLAARYGVHRDSILNVRLGRTWKHVT